MPLGISAVVEERLSSGCASAFSFLKCFCHCWSGDRNGVWSVNKNSSGDEIANVNFYAVRPGSYRNLLK